MLGSTVLNCGTNFDGYKGGQLISDFGAEMQGAEYEQSLTTDGVDEGSKQNPLSDAPESAYPDPAPPTSAPAVNVLLFSFDAPLLHNVLLHKNQISGHRHTDTREENSQYYCV